MIHPLATAFVAVLHQLLLATCGRPMLTVDNTGTYACESCCCTRRPPGGGGKLWALKVAPEGSEEQQRLKHAGTVMRKLKGIVPDVVAMGQCAEGGYVLATEQILNCATYNQNLHSSCSDRVRQAVQNMHKARVTHGELQPEHILIDDAGKPWLVGFGDSSMNATRHERDDEFELLEDMWSWTIDE
jgi:hypothetical protein